MTLRLTRACLCLVTSQISRSLCLSDSPTFDVTSAVSVTSDQLVTASCATSSLTFAARRGQQLNISLVDFSSDLDRAGSSTCINYATVEDVHATPNNAITVCAQEERERHVMLSQGHEVKVKFHIYERDNQRFLLRLEGVFTATANSTILCFSAFPHNANCKLRCSCRLRRHSSTGRSVGGARW